MKTQTFRICVDGRKRRFSNTVMSSLESSHPRSLEMKITDSRKVVSLLVGLLSSLIDCMQLHFTLLNLQAEYLRRRLDIARFLSV